MDFSRLTQLYQDCEIVGNKIIVKNSLIEIIKNIKENFGFNMLKEIVGTDYHEGIELDYRLYSVNDDEDLIITIFVKDEAESVSHIFNSAIADENEIYDLLGVNFIGNSEQKRIYMPESWIGHPLKKDYIENDERLMWNE